MTPLTPTELGSPVLNAHIALALLGYTSFCLSFLYSIIYLILHDEIKRSNFGLIYEKLPSLEQLDDMNFKSAAAGAAVMSLSILIGFVWAWTAFGRLPFGDLKVLAAIGTTALYAAMIVLRRRFGWGGERAAIMSLVCFFAVLVSLLLLNVFAETLHSYF
jgi:ABC-type transport system involved in cytochrome c biogenesis permease subunit